MDVSPVLVAIVACEVGFWLVLAAGLLLRYGLRRRTASTWVLRSIPLVDLALLAAVAADVAGGAEVGQVHRLAGIYLGVTVAFGHSIVAWADVRVAHRFAGGSPPEPTPKGRAALAIEVRSFLRWLLAAAIALAATGLLAVTVADRAQADALWGIVGHSGSSRSSGRSAGRSGRWPRRLAGAILTHDRRRPPRRIRGGRRRYVRCRSVQVIAQDLRPAGVTQLRHGLRLDLADALTRHAVDLADLVEGAGLPVGEAETQSDDARLTLRQRLEDRLQLILEKGERDRVDGHDGLGVLDEVTELTVALVADGLVERDGLPGVLLDLQHLLRGDVHLLGELSGVGSRPRSCRSSRWMRPSLLMTSTMCTGMRMVRAWSAMAR